MKKISLSAALFLGLFLFLASCKKTTTPNGGDNAIPCVLSTDSLHVQISTDTVTKNGFDFIRITVYDDAGNNITSACNLLLGGLTLIDSIYYPATLGNANIIARAKDCSTLPSTFKTIHSIASPFSQKILLEDCTGAWCGYCPRVAFQLENYKASHPNCISLAVHGGGSGNVDPMKFQYYPTFNSAFQVGGYPTAVFNRKKQPDGSYGWSESNSDLDAALKLGAPLGLAISSTTDGLSVTGSVKVKFGVTTTKAMKIVVALVENGIVYPQTNYYSAQYGATPYIYGGVSPVTNFVHNGVLRRTSTNLLGDAIPVNQETKDNIWELPFTMSLSGNTAEGTYSAIPANCSIVAFVMDATTTNKGVYNVQYATVGSVKNFD
ncbi:MAG: Omp28-related outer membrane protein [Bacteroidota bacterium]